MRVLVTGAAGFIGSHLCDRLIERGLEVYAIDNLHLGTFRNLIQLTGHPTFRFENLDILDRNKLNAVFTTVRFDAVFHLAANSDIAAGNLDVNLDLNLNCLATVALLEAMRNCGVKRFFFASTSAVFGGFEGAISENDGPLQPISFYGASKLAAEAYISVYAHTFGITAVILRFPNVVGERVTHGAVHDFVHTLKADPRRLKVLGNGHQTKPYMYVADLVEALLLAWERSTGPLSLYHAAGVGETSVREVADIVVAKFGKANTRIEYGEGDRGWPGDVPRFTYNTARLQVLGWKPRLHSTEAVRLAVDRIFSNGF
jgi:UDP-glucose 4-epimerase